MQNIHCQWDVKYWRYNVTLNGECSNNGISLFIACHDGNLHHLETIIQPFVRRNILELFTTGINLAWFKLIGNAWCLYIMLVCEHFSQNVALGSTTNSSQSISKGKNNTYSLCSILCVWVKESLLIVLTALNSLLPFEYCGGSLCYLLITLSFNLPSEILDQSKKGIIFEMSPKLSFCVVFFLFWLEAYLSKFMLLKPCTIQESQLAHCQPFLLCSVLKFEVPLLI